MQEYWSGLSCPRPGDLPNPGMEPGSPALQADSLPFEPLGKAQHRYSRYSTSCQQTRAQNLGPTGIPLVPRSFATQLIAFNTFPNTASLLGKSQVLKEKESKCLKVTSL